MQKESDQKGKINEGMMTLPITTDENLKWMTWKKFEFEQNIQIFSRISDKMINRAR